MDYRGVRLQRGWITEGLDYRGGGLQRGWITEGLDYRGGGLLRSHCIRTLSPYSLFLFSFDWLLGIFYLLISLFMIVQLLHHTGVSQIGGQFPCPC